MSYNYNGKMIFKTEQNPSKESRVDLINKYQDIIKDSPEDEVKLVKITEEEFINYP